MTTGAARWESGRYVRGDDGTGTVHRWLARGFGVVALGVLLECSARRGGGVDRDPPCPRIPESHRLWPPGHPRNCRYRGRIGRGGLRADRNSFSRLDVRHRDCRHRRHSRVGCLPADRTAGAVTVLASQPLSFPPIHRRQPHHPGRVHGGRWCVVPVGLAATTKPALLRATGWARDATHDDHHVDRFSVDRRVRAANRSAGPHDRRTAHRRTRRGVDGPRRARGDLSGCGPARRGRVRPRVGGHRGAADFGGPLRSPRHLCRHGIRCQQRHLARRRTPRRRRAAGRGRYPRGPRSTARPRLLTGHADHRRRLPDRWNHRMGDHSHRHRRRTPGAARNRPRLPGPVHQTPETAPGTRPSR